MNPEALKKLADVLTVTLAPGTLLGLLIVGIWEQKWTGYLDPTKGPFGIPLAVVVVLICVRLGGWVSDWLDRPKPEQETETDA